MKVRKGMSRKRTFFMWFLLIILTLSAIEILAQTLLLFIPEHFEVRKVIDILEEQSRRINDLLYSKSNQLLYDPTLGWEYRKDFNDSLTSINSQGLRSLREYSLDPGKEILRIAAFGDSFVYCHEVVTKDSWPVKLEVKFNNIEVLNYGVGGYGTDQAYLRYLEEGRKLSPEIVLIGFHPVNLRRVVNVYRRYISTREHALFKPRFNIGNGNELELIPSPVTKNVEYKELINNPRKVFDLGENDDWFEPLIYRNPFYDSSATIRLATTLWIKIKRKYVAANRLYIQGVFNKKSSAFKIQTLIIKKFVDEVSATGALPIVLIFPDRESLTNVRNGRKPVYIPLREYLEDEGIKHIDLSNAFLSTKSEWNINGWFADYNHYSPEGNRIVASWIATRILKDYPGTTTN